MSAEDASAAASPSSSRLARALQIACIAAAIGAPLGVLLALLAGPPLARNVQLLPVLIDLYLVQGIVTAALGVGVWLASFRLLTRIVPSDAWRARLAGLLPCWLPSSGSCG